MICVYFTKIQKGTRLNNALLCDTRREIFPKQNYIKARERSASGFEEKKLVSPQTEVVAIFSDLNFAGERTGLKASVAEET